MTFTRILVPYDGSEHAASALACAVDLAKLEPTAQVCVLTVVPTTAVAPAVQSPDPLDSLGTVPAGLLDRDQYIELTEHAQAAAKKSLTESVSSAVDPLGERATCEAVVAIGARDGIVDFAQKWGADLIVMGRRGVGRLRGMLGSVSFGVLSACDIPVLTVK